MKRLECLERLKSGDKEFHSLYWTNYNKAKSFFKPLIEDMKLERPGMDIVLHHIEVNDNNYEQWDTVIPLYNDEHYAVHKSIIDSRKKGKKAWNKGLRGVSKETSERMRNSQLGKKQSKETIEKRRKSMIGKKNGLGYRHTEEAKRKISNAGRMRYLQTREAS